MRSKKQALGIVNLMGKSRINSVGKITVCLLLLLSLPVSVVTETRERAIAQTQNREERKQEALRLNQLGFEQFNKNQFREALERFQEVLEIFREIGDTTGLGTTLYNIGAVYQKLGQYPKALEFYQQALAIKKQIGDTAGEGAILYDIGEAYRNLGEYPKALDIYKQASEIFKQVGDKTREGDALTNIGSVYLKLGQYPKALDFFQQSLVIIREIDSKEREGTILNNIGGVYIDLGQYQKALERLQQALAIHKHLGNKVEEGTTLSNIGEAYHQLGEYPKALDFFQQALAIQKHFGNKALEGTLISNIGGVYRKLGQYSKALELYQQALAIYKQVGDKQREGTNLNETALVYESLGQYSKALDFYQQALTINKQINDKEEEGTNLHNIGEVYRNLGQYPKALDLYQQALTISKQIGDRKGEGTNLNGIGLVYESLGQYSEALNSYQQALTIHKRIDDKEGKASTLNNIALLYKYLGQYSEALEFYQQALTIAKQIGDKKGEGNILNNIGELYRKVGEYSKALDLYQQALKIVKHIGDKYVETSTLNNLGSLYIDSEQYPKALIFYKQALMISKQIDDKREGRILNNIGYVYMNLGQYNQALNFYNQALTIIKQIGDKEAEGDSFNNTGYALMKTGKQKEAIEMLHAAIEAYESLRPRLKDADKVSIIETQKSPYRSLQQAYIAQNQHEKALEISERSRARAFVELLAEKQKTSVQPKPTINQLKQIAQEQKATLVEYSIIGEKFKIEGKKQWLESKLYIWVIKPTGEVKFQSVDLRQKNITIASLIPRFRKSLNLSSRSAGEPIFKPGDKVRFQDDGADAQLWEIISFDAQKREITVRYPTFAPGLTTTRSIIEVDDRKQASLQELHKLLIEPIADLLPTKESDKIIFIPQEELFSVPFPALQDVKGKFLIEKHTILTAPSIQVLDLTRKQRQKLPGNLKEVLVVGNPSPMPNPFTPLKHATPEAQAVAKLYNTQAIIDSAATESVIVAKMPDARIIHLATHGDFNNTKGLESFIVLAPDSKNNGLLTAGEIFDLFGQPDSKSSLHAELVVLSACDTGRGEITGDGVIGLSRSLISAGVPSVVVSLWGVDDAATEFLMTEFYKQLKNNSDKATALRNAMLATMKKDSNPRLWAAFTLIGEADRDYSLLGTRLPIFLIFLLGALGSGAVFYIGIHKRGSGVVQDINKKNIPRDF